MKFGPDYYREYKQPEISYRQYPPVGNSTHERDIRFANRYYYRISFPYNPAEETLSKKYAAEVDIWEDTFEPYSVMFGCGWGKGIPEGMDWRNDTTIEVQPYYEAIRPKYAIPPPIIIPDSIYPDEKARNEFIEKAEKAFKENPPDPINMEELISRGWELRNGAWVRTRPDVPPQKRKQQL